MLGAIIGDMVGSPYEFSKANVKKVNIYDPRCRMTDDSLLTLAVIRVLSNNYPIKFDKDSQAKIQQELTHELIRTWNGNRDAGYGEKFYLWCQQNQYSENVPFNNSIGNGAAMRVSPVGWVCNTLDEVKILSKTVSEITHNTEEGLKGAEAVATAVFLAKEGHGKDDIQSHLEKYYPELSNMTIKSLMNKKPSCLAGDTVPIALCCFLKSKSYMNTMINALKIGVDTDTICSMSLAMAEAYYSRDKLNEFEDHYLYWMIDPGVETLLREFYSLIGNNKLAWGK